MGKLRSSSKEKSWAKFHGFISTCKIVIPGLDDPTRNFFPLKLFELVLAKCWPQEQVPVYTSQLSSEEDDIISYVGGSVVKKLMAAKYTNRSIVQLLACQSDDPCAAHISLTKIKDRGGLTYIKQSAFELFKKMEIVFRSLATVKGEVDKLKFESMCRSSLEDDFLFCIIEGGDELPTESVLFCVLNHIIRLFFKIRMHHRCKVTLEKISKDNIKKKGLRKGLKAANKSGKSKK